MSVGVQPPRRRTRRIVWVIRAAAVLLALILAVGLAYRYATRPTLALETIASGFDRPTALVDLDGRLLVSQQDGLIRYLDDPTPFVDLTDVVNSGDWEQGLWDMAISPDYPADDRLFITYAAANNDAVLASLHLGGERHDLREILRVPKPTPVHNGGRMAFGPDGYLYLGYGDGGPGEVPDPDRQGQNPATLLSTIVRLDVSAEGSYADPPDNPYVDGGAGAPEVWAFGVRNPYGISFDPVTGDLWLVDVGHAAHEEVNFIPAGSAAPLNFGWSQYEGASCFRPDEGCSTDGLMMPVVDMDHEDGSCSVIGGEVYRGTGIAHLVGRYVFSDYCTGRIESVAVSGTEVNVSLELDSDVQPTAIERDSEGNLYVLTYSGQISRLVDAD